MSDLERKEPVEKTIFPVGKAAVVRALAEISVDPDTAAIEEGELIRMNDPALNRLGQDRFITYGTDDRYEYIDGLLIGHRILRIQAELSGQPLPILTDRIAGAHLNDMLQRIRSKKRSKLYVPASFSEALAAEITVLDPEYGGAMREVTKYRRTREGVLGGMAEIYLIMKKADTAGKLGKWQVGPDK
jgi:hypothetical protein